MNKNLRSLDVGIAKEKQRFSIRKLTIGVASVLLGTAFLFGASQTVQADALQPSEQSQSVQQSINKDDSNQITVGKQEKVITTTVSDSKENDVNQNEKLIVSADKSVKTIDSSRDAKQVTITDPNSKVENNGENTEKTQTVRQNNVQAEGSTADNADKKQEDTVSYSEKENQDTDSSQQTTEKVKVSDLENLDHETSAAKASVFKTSLKEKAPSESTNDDAALTINFEDKDDENNHLVPITITGKINDDVTDKVNQVLRDKEAENYELWTKGGWDPYKVFDDPEGTYELVKPEILDKTSKELTIHLKHKRIYVDYQHPKTTNDVVPETGQHYPTGLTKDDLFHAYTRTIHYHYLDGTTKDKVVQTINASRRGYEDLVTGKWGYEPWSSDSSLWDTYYFPNPDTYLTPQGWAKIGPYGSGSQYQSASCITASHFEFKNYDIDAYVGHITYHVKYEDALTGLPLQVIVSNLQTHLTNVDGVQDVEMGCNITGKAIGEYQKDSKFRPFVAPITGYKFIGYKDSNGQSGDWNTLRNQKIGSTDRTLIFEYAPLSPIQVEYIDQKDGKVLMSLTMPTKTALPESVEHAEKAGPYNYETHPLNNIPGYEYTNVCSDNVNGFVGQVQKKDDINPIIVKYYYKVIPGQEKIAEYTRSMQQSGKAGELLQPYIPSGSVDGKIDYSNVPGYIKWYTDSTGHEFMGGVNTKNGYFSYSRNSIGLYFVPLQGVKIHYVDLTTEKKLGDSDYDITPRVWSSTDWHGSQKEFPGYVFVTTDRSTQGKFGSVEQEVTYYYAPIAIKKTETKTAERTIHYVADTHDGKQLQADSNQKVTLIGTYFVDESGKRTGAKEITLENGDKAYILDKNGSTATTWTVDTTKSTGLTEDKKGFTEVKTPKTITLDDGEATSRGVDKGDWYLANTIDNGQVVYGDPSHDWKGNLTDAYLIYKQKAQYNIHYIDVNESDKTSDFVPTDGEEMTTHLVSNINGDVGDKSHAKLWNTYGDEGYVVVGFGNVSDNNLGTQVFAEGMKDQYVYLKHAVKTITSKTPIDEVPKNPDGKPVVDPNDLHKEFTRHITFVANDTNHSPLKDEVTQTVSFDRHIYVDVVTGKTTTPETVKDADGNDVQVATTNPGQIIWDKSSQTMEAVDQPTITLNSGDRYATSDSMIGTWKLASGKADAIDLTPGSSNPKDVQLVYEKEVQPGGNTGDQPSGKLSDNPGNEPSGQPGNEPSNNPGDKGSKTPGKPDENKPDEPKKDNTKKPEEKKPQEKKSNKKTPQKKNPSKKSTKKSPTKSNKTKQSKKSPTSVKKVVNKTSNNAPRAENMYRNNSPLGEDMYRNNAPTPESDNVTMPKSEVIDQTSGKPAGLVDNTTVGANGGTVNGTKVNTLPQTGEKQSDAAAFGLIALAFAGLASFVGVDRKKKRN